MSNPPEEMAATSTTEMSNPPEEMALSHAFNPPRS
ncbi:hypothetical protein A2U01_0106358, partial [Trifolium medium]|nr:hypothetical protein [Trifolium medium]